MNSPPTREQFLEWRHPRFGTTNPERLNNSAWEWLIREHADWNAYSIRKHFGLEAEFGTGPD